MNIRAGEFCEESTQYDRGRIQKIVCILSEENCVADTPTHCFCITARINSIGRVVSKSFGYRKR